jgi:transcriptional regulator with XRE-family HTH domain
MTGAIAASVRDARKAIGWTQAELAVRAGLSRTMITAIEAGRINLTMASAGAVLDELGVRVRVQLEAPFLAARERQREPVHARTIGYVGRRLTASGWQTRNEVEIGDPSSRGWIDLLAFEPGSQALLVIEVKTEIHDVGAIDRQLARYERQAWAAARSFGWQVSRTCGLLVVVETVENDLRLTMNRDYLAQAWPMRARDVPTLFADPSLARPTGRRAVFMVDPLSRRRAWAIPTRVDGRRSVAPYADYADLARRLVRRPSGSRGTESRV